MNSLDITSWKERGQELSKAIELAVKDTQRVIVRPYPDRIIMSRKQYDILSKKGELQNMDPSLKTQEFWLYRTRYNIMEVEIK